MRSLPPLGCRPPVSVGFLVFVLAPWVARLGRALVVDSPLSCGYATGGGDFRSSGWGASCRLGGFLGALPFFPLVFLCWLVGAVGGSGGWCFGC